MALKPPPPPWEVIAQVGDMVGGTGTREEIDRNIRSLAQSALSRLDMVSREEFDAQAELLQRRTVLGGGGHARCGWPPARVDQRW